MGFNDKHRTGCKYRKFHEAILQMGQSIIHTIRNMEWALMTSTELVANKGNFMRLYCRWGNP